MAKERKRDERDEALMSAFLVSVEGLSNAEAGELIGSTGESVRLYRAGKWTRLEAETKRRMREHLDAEPPRDVDGYRAGLLAAAERAEEMAQDLRRMAASSRRSTSRVAPDDIVESADVDPLVPGDGVRRRG